MAVHAERPPELHSGDWWTVHRRGRDCWRPHAPAVRPRARTVSDRAGGSPLRRGGDDSVPAVVVIHPPVSGTESARAHQPLGTGLVSRAMGTRGGPTRDTGSTGA